EGRGSKQPEGAPLETDPREEETGRDRGKDEAGEPEVQERDHVDEEEADLLARPERERLDVVDVGDEQDREQDELRPLRRVAEEGPDLLAGQRTYGGRPWRPDRREDAAAAAAPLLQRAPLLRAAVAVAVE